MIFKGEEVGKSAADEEGGSNKIMEMGVERDAKKYCEVQEDELVLFVRLLKVNEQGDEEQERLNDVVRKLGEMHFFVR